jgi:hypothetical protein
MPTVMDSPVTTSRRLAPGADRHLKLAFQHDEVLVLLAVDMHRHAVAGLDHQLDH